MNKSHEDLQSLLPFYAANQLSINEQHLVEQHLVQCPDCYVALNEWKQIANAVKLHAHRARSLPPLHMPQRTMSLQWRLAVMGIAVLSFGVLLILLMPQLVFVLPQYTNSNATPTVAPTIQSVVPKTFHADNYEWEPQTWNNQGPANLVQVLHHFGWTGTQAQVASVLKPNPDDKYVTVPEMVEYVNTQTQFAATSRIIGTDKLLRKLIAADFGVIVAVGYEIPDVGWFGHYLTVTGYDEAKQEFYVLDTYAGDGTDHKGIIYDHKSLDKSWMQFNRAYIVIYQKERETELLKLLGVDSYIAGNYRRAAIIAQRDAVHLYPDSFFPWLNLCEVSLHYHPDMNSFTNCNMATTGTFNYRVLQYRQELLEANYRIGDYSRVIVLANNALNFTKDVEELYYWRGIAYAEKDQISNAIEDLDTAVRLNPNFKKAQEALKQLKSQVDS
jgi:tetratricopeptide (TPR) repeat protein